MMKWNVWNGHLAFVLVSLVWSYFAAVQRLAIKVVEGNEVVENLISMIPGKKSCAFAFLCSFLFESRVQDDGIETAVYIWGMDVLV